MYRDAFANRMNETRNAFVIIPFTPEFDKVYDRVIKPICEDLGYEVEKADSTDTQQNILRDVVDGISNADLLIADLTNSNANVFYEAGIAHGLGIPTILITQSVDSVPFDLQAYNMIEYSTDFVEIEDFESELRDVGEKHLNGEVEFGSPVSDFANVDIKLPDASDDGGTETDTADRVDETEEVSEADEADESSTEPEKGVLDYAEEAEEEQSNLINSVSRIVDGMEDLQIQLSEHTQRITAITESQDQVSPRRANTLSKRAANDIRGYANSISDDTESVEESLGVMMDAEENFINFADPTNEDHRENLKERRDGLKEFRYGAQDAIEGLDDFYYEATQLRGISRALTQAVDELTGNLSDLMGTLTSAESRAERMIQLIEQKLAEEDQKPSS